MNLLHAATLLFVGLKLAEVIAWSWWLVLAPSLLHLGLLAIFLLVFGLASIAQPKNRWN